MVNRDVFFPAAIPNEATLAVALAVTLENGEKRMWIQSKLKHQGAASLQDIGQAA